LVDLCLQIFSNKGREEVIFGVVSQKGLLVIFSNRCLPFFEAKQPWAKFVT